jgi:hypothetical protein
MLKKEYSYLLHLWAFVACSRVKLTFTGAVERRMDLIVAFSMMRELGPSRGLREWKLFPQM